MLLQMIDKYIAKVDKELAHDLDGAGFLYPEETVAEMNIYEEKIADALKRESKRILSAVKSSEDLLYFSDYVWGGVKQSDTLADELEGIFLEMFTETLPVLINAYIAQTNPELAEKLKVIKQIDSPNFFAVLTAGLMARITEWSRRLGAIMMSSTHSAIDGLLANSIEHNGNIEEFIESLYENSDEYLRARTAAQTEILTCHSIAAAEAFRQASVKEKIWRHSGEGNPREHHVEMDGQRVPVDQPFTLHGYNGVYYPMTPRDPDLPPEERCNCKCFIEPAGGNSDYSDYDYLDDDYMIKY